MNLLTISVIPRSLIQSYLYISLHIKIKIIQSFFILLKVEFYDKSVRDSEFCTKYHNGPLYLKKVFVDSEISD